MAPVLEANHITRCFGAVVANEDVNLALEPGEIHILLGENGAGKTTLMNILYGLERPDEGEVRVNGKPVQFASPKDAIRQGIAMVHQHFMLVPVFTVLENILLGVEQTTGRSRWMGLLGRLDLAHPKRRVRDLAEQLSLSVDLNALVGNLPVGVQQKVEIIKALYRGARVLILDEPTAVLTPAESVELFDLLRMLAQQGLAIVMITHKLKEGLAIADRISVMRQGRMVGTADPRTATEASLAELMVGRSVLLQVEKPVLQVGEPVLQVRSLRVLDDRHHAALRGVNLTVRAGEVLGIAGVQGNGQTELAEAIAGLRPIEQGQIELLGQDCTHASPRSRLELGLAHVPEDRGRNGLVKAYSLADNAVLCTYYQPPFARGLVRRQEVVDRHATRLIELFDVRPANPRYGAGSLSGGNQQKLIMARELSRGAKVLLVCQPTRGVDIGAIELIHNHLMSARQQGVGILLISSELDEILALSDRVAVMYQGQLLDTLPITRTSREQLGQLMAGIRLDVPSNRYP